jgi:hypothetical protein
MAGQLMEAGFSVRDERRPMALLLLLLLSALVLPSCEPGSSDRSTPSPSAGESPSAATELWRVRRIRTSAPNPFAVQEGSVWIAGSLMDSGEPGVARLDRATGRLEGRTVFGYLHEDVVVAFGSLWVANNSGACVAYSCGMGGDSPPQQPEFPGENSVTRHDPSTLEMVDAIHVTGPYRISAAFGSIWVSAWGSARRSDIIRIDPARNEIVGQVRLLGDPAPLVEAAGAVWTLAKADSPRARKWILAGIHPRQMKVVQTVELPRLGGPTSLAAWRGDLWVGGRTGRVVRADAVTGRVVQVLDSGVPLRDLSAGPAGVWVIGPRDLVRIDEGRPAVSYRIGGAPMWLGQQAMGRLWVMSTRGLFAWPPAD